MFWRNLHKFNANNVYTTQTYFSPNKFCDKIETTFVFYFILFNKKNQKSKFSKFRKYKLVNSTFFPASP